MPITVNHKDQCVTATKSLCEMNEGHNNDDICHLSWYGITPNGPPHGQDNDFEDIHITLTLLVML